MQVHRNICGQRLSCTKNGKSKAEVDYKNGAISLCDSKQRGQSFMNFMLPFMSQTTSGICINHLSCIKNKTNNLNLRLNTLVNHFYEHFMAHFSFLTWPAMVTGTQFFSGLFRSLKRQLRPNKTWQGDPKEPFLKMLI